MIVYFHLMYYCISSSPKLYFSYSYLLLIYYLGRVLEFIDPSLLACMIIITSRVSNSNFSFIGGTFFALRAHRARR